MPKRLAATTLLILAASGVVPVSADDAACAKRIGDLLKRSVSDVRPGRATMTIEMKGAPAMVSEYLLAGPSHGLHKPVSPPSPSWTLTTPGAMFQSTDGGKTWKKVRTFDAAAQKAQTEKTVAAQAQSITEAVCGNEPIDGVAHDKLEATITNPPPGEFKMRNTYWMNSETGFISKTIMRVVSGGPKSVTTQEWTPAPGLKLPKPE
jgi:hypothetical protein